VEPLFLHVYLARSGDRTVMLWAGLNEDMVKQGPEAVEEAERLIVGTLDRIQFLK
jgi:hypothetical protein